MKKLSRTEYIKLHWIDPMPICEAVKFGVRNRSKSGRVEVLLKSRRLDKEDIDLHFFDEGFYLIAKKEVTKYVAPMFWCARFNGEGHRKICKRNAHRQCPRARSLLKIKIN